jgi:hypothetical protein
MDNLIGSFELKSTFLRVSDPAYEKDTWCTGLIGNCIPGKWNACILRDSGVIAELIVYESNNDSNSVHWDLTDFDIGVDSGQCGFYDEDQYVDGNRRHDQDAGEFYDSILNLDNGMLPYGVISQSGYGDGLYSCYIAKNSGGFVIAAKVVFISDDEDEEEF